MSVSGDSARAPLARALSKLGFCSRRKAVEMIQAGKVRVNGKVARNPMELVRLGRDAIEAAGEKVADAEKVYLMLNKPRGLVTTASDEQGRDTVFKCLRGQWGSGQNRQSQENSAPPCVFAVGRLDKASEGLLLFTNDTAWAARITDPTAAIEKTYHVQIDRIANEDFLRRMELGVTSDGDILAAKHARLIRAGGRNCWIEAILTEGKNRHLRRMMEAMDAEVLRLIRVSIGGLHLGNLAKGAFRHLTRDEVNALR